MPGLLQGGIVAAEIQAFRFADEGETVGRRVAWVLQLVLTELLRRRLVDQTGRDVGDGLLRVVEKLAAGMGGQQLVTLGQIEVAHQGIVEFAHDGMRLAVFQPGGETELPVLERDAEVQADVQRVPVAVQFIIVDSDHSVRHADRRCLVGCPYFDLLALRRVVIQAP